MANEEHLKILKLLVLKIYRYDSLNNLLASFEKEVIMPAEAKVKELRQKGDGN